MSELLRALGALAEPPGPTQRRIAAALGLPGTLEAADHTELFVLQLYPYASVHLGAEGMLGGDARDRVAGFWRSLGVTPPAEPDHLTALLGLYAALVEREADAAAPAGAADAGSHGSIGPAESASIAGDGAAGAATGDDRAPWRRARHALLWEHLLPWLPPYLERVRELGSPAYAHWAALLRDALMAEAVAVGPPARLPLHLRVAGPAPDAAAPDELPTLLLAPVRSGLLLTRADLARCAQQLGLGLRMGERRFILGTLLEQEPARVPAWLADRAEAVAARHAMLPAELGDVAAFWHSRALATAAALRCWRPASAAGPSATAKGGARAARC